MVLSKRQKIFFKTLSLVLNFVFILNFVVYPLELRAQSLPWPATGGLVSTSPGFVPLMIKGVTINPNNPRSLFGLSEALKAQNNAEADNFRQQFEKAWQGADVEISIPTL